MNKIIMAREFGSTTVVNTGIQNSLSVTCGRPTCGYQGALELLVTMSVPKVREIYSMGSKISIFCSICGQLQCAHVGGAPFA